MKKGFIMSSMSVHKRSQRVRQPLQQKTPHRQDAGFYHGRGSP